MAPPTSSNLPIQKIPGDYGLPFFGSIKDRWDYIYTQLPDEFFKSRMLKYNSTVFRTNVPPGPFIAINSKVIVLADAASYPTVFDPAKVDKADVLIGPYMPAPSFTGGYRMCAYQDTTEPSHTKLKKLFLSIISKVHHDKYFSESKRSFNDLFDQLDAVVFSKAGEADFNALSENMSMVYIFRLIFDVDLMNTAIGTGGPGLVVKWQLPQLLPSITLKLPLIPNCVEDLLIHYFRYPSFIVNPQYKKFYDVIHENTGPILDEAEKLGIKRDEACHNLFFFICINGWGGMKYLFPSVMKWVGLGGEKLHKQLTHEIRTAAKAEGGLTKSALDSLKLTHSVIYEALRMEPPVPKMWGRAREDMIIESQEARYEVKKGELLLGFLPLAHRDPKVFTNPEEFIGSRFVGEEGEKLLKYIYWSNNRSTENPSDMNKQCPAKNLVIIIAKIMVAEFFLRYNTFTVASTPLPVGSTVKITSLTKATTDYNN